MIIVYAPEGWKVVTQRSHGIVAAQLAFHWKQKERPSRWVETILAIAEHDDAENELDGETLLTDTGGPLNYAMKSFDLEHCKSLASLTLTKSRYNALLTSMHMTFLYGQDTKSDPVARKFLREQETLQKKWREELKLSETEALRIYNLMEWCDALSLLLCKNEMPENDRSVEISTGPDKVTYQLKKAGDQLTVAPWPFDETSIEIRYETRMISQIQFKSSAEFRDAFLHAPVEEVCLQLKKMPTASSRKKADKKLKT